MTDTLLSVAQACRVLGVSERTLRRILREPEMAAKIQAKDRQTRTGLRRSSLLSPELLNEISQRLSLAETSLNDDGDNTGRRQADIVQMYENLLAEKDRRIGDLTAALNHERAQSRRHAEALTRAQELLAQADRPAQQPREFWKSLLGMKR